MIILKVHINQVTALSCVSCLDDSNNESNV